jgi:GntR family transcriptional regulator, transcriptional repressor for pyruvate dehydrogenase complex
MPGSRRDTVEEKQLPEGGLSPQKQKKTLMVEHAVLALKEYILGGNLSAGTELPPESEMVREMGISKFSLREALRVLQVIGLIEISQGRRTRVASHSISPLVSLFEIALKRSTVTNPLLIEARKSIEGHIARYAAMRAEPADIKTMQQTIEDIDHHRDDLEICVNKDIEFHSALVSASKNEVFEIMLAPIMELLREQRREQLRVKGVDAVIEYHAMILAAVMERDPDKAERCMGLHLMQAEQDIREAEQVMKRRPRATEPRQGIS